MGWKFEKFKNVLSWKGKERERERERETERDRERQTPGLRQSLVCAEVGRLGQ